MTNHTPCCLSICFAFSKPQNFVLKLHQAVQHLWIQDQPKSQRGARGGSTREARSDAEKVGVAPAKDDAQIRAALRPFVTMTRFPDYHLCIPYPSV